MNTMPLALMLCMLGTETCVACLPPVGKPKVETAERAIEIARASWKGIEWKRGSDSIYGMNQTSRFEPYTATPQDNAWIVRGTLPPGFHGQTLVTTICSADETVSVEGIVVR